MQTALHILSLVNELKAEIVGGQIVSTEFYKKERAVYLFIKNKQRTALAFVYHPAGFGTFALPASKVVIDTREKPWPLFGLDGAIVTRVEQAGLDRIFQVVIEHENAIKRLVFEAIGPNGNIWLLDNQNRKLATLRKKDFQPGDIYAIPPPSDKLLPTDLNAEVLAERAQEQPPLSLANFIDRNILGFNLTMARDLAKRSAVEVPSVGEMAESDWQEVIRAARQIVSFFESADTGYLYQTAGGVEAYPYKLSFSDQPPQKFKTLSLAVMTLTQMRQTVSGQQDEEKIYRDVIRRYIKKLEKRLGGVQKDIEEASNYEQYKKMAELLQINFTRLKKGMTSIVVDDIYGESHETVEISLDPALGPNDNMEAYFKKHRKGREGLELLKRRYDITRDELASWMQIADELENNFEQARERYRQELASLMPVAGEKTDSVQRLPYRPLTLSTGLTIFVGRDGDDNDRTTFDFSKPYELWFHTQQCPGSHVVMKFPNKSFVPSKTEIEQTAAIAAYFSKARNDSLVPVIYTERRYVRKPRKAKPGLVTVEREKSVMVVPKKPEAE